MTIAFYYAQVGFISFLGIVLGVSASLFLIRSGKSLKREIINSNLFVKIGILNLLIIIFSLIIPNIKLTFPYSPEAGDFLLFKILMLSLFVLMPLVPKILIFGILFIKIGKNNKEKFGKLLKAGGLIWICSYFLAIISLYNLYLYNSALPAAELLFANYSIFLYLYFISLGLSIFAYFLLIIYARKVKSLNLTLSCTFFFALLGGIIIVMIYTYPFTFFLYFNYKVGFFI